MKTSARILVALAIAAVAAAPALAQEEAGGASPTLQKFGLRAGWTSWDSLNQFHFGAHYLAGELFPNVELTPNVEIGVGDDATIVAVQADLAYQFTEFFQKPWGLYGGGSLAFNYYKPSGFDSDTDLGLSLVAGGKYDFASGRQGMLEIRVGLMDSPDFKLTVGTTLF
jgi:hypothetical protein